MRTMEEITKEYVDICAKAGDLHFRMSLMAKNIKELEDRMSVLNKEADALNKEKAEKPNE